MDINIAEKNTPWQLAHAKDMQI